MDCNVIGIMVREDLFVLLAQEPNKDEGASNKPQWEGVVSKDPHRNTCNGAPKS